MESKSDKILVIGACGQLGSELTMALRNQYDAYQIIAADLQPRVKEVAESGTFERLDVMDARRLGEIIDRHRITQIYHLAALLSAAGERNPTQAWQLNMDGLLNVLEAAREKKLRKVFWPSSIAAFGTNTPKEQTPQHTVMDPTTVYGISKLAGERWCEYYFQKHGVDVRSLRYPGLISYKTPPGGGTTDYAIDIYHRALEEGTFTCFLSKDTYLPMMYMPDAIQATLQLMKAETRRVTIRSSYNVGALSFSPGEIATAIKQHLPEFTIRYHPDFRQQIAESWPRSIDDSVARADWNWQPAYDLDQMTEDMLVNLRKLKTQEVT